MKILLRIKFIVLILLMAWNSGTTQYSGLDMLDGELRKEIPFKYVNGFIVVKVYYANFFQLNFLFDTGASHNILFKKNVNDLLGIEYTDTIYISGADIQLRMKAMVSRNIPMQLEKTKMIKRDIIVLEEDFLELERTLGMRVDGILGGDFFKGLVVGIDHRKDKITIYNPNRFVPNSKFSEHDIDIQNYKPYMKCETQIAGVSDTLNYLIDSGASLALLIHSNRDKKFEMPENVIIGNLGKGLGGDIHGYVGLIDGMSIDDEYRIPNIITSFQEIDSAYLETENIIRDGIIGNVILSRFHLVIDYMREKLYLKKVSKLDEEFDYDKSGMLIYALGEKLNEYYIKTIYPDTPAQEAGLLPGDKILKIGFWSSKFYSLSGILSKLQGKEGKKIKIKVERNGEVIKTEFRLRNLFTKNKKGVSQQNETPK